MYHYLALDLEFNQPSEKPLQLGAVVGDSDGNVIHSFNLMIDPGEEINPEIWRLCRFDQSRKVGVPIVSPEEAFNAFCIWHQNIKETLKDTLFPNVLTWSTGDLEQVQAMCPARPSPLLGRPIDVKTVYQAVRLAKGLSHRAGLAKACMRSGFAFKGTCHNAYCDALNTYHLWIQLKDKLK